jgi:hypothetical protein
LSHHLIKTIISTQQKGQERPPFPNEGVPAATISPEKPGDCVYFALRVKGMIGHGNCVHTGIPGALLIKKGSVNTDMRKSEEEKEEEKEKAEEEEDDQK